MKQRLRFRVPEPESVCWCLPSGSSAAASFAALSASVSHGARSGAVEDLHVDDVSVEGDPRQGGFGGDRHAEGGCLSTTAGLAACAVFSDAFDALFRGALNPGPSEPSLPFPQPTSTPAVSAVPRTATSVVCVTRKNAIRPEAIKHRGYFQREGFQSILRTSVEIPLAASPRNRQKCPWRSETLAPTDPLHTCWASSGPCDSIVSGVLAPGCNVSGCG